MKTRHPHPRRQRRIQRRPARTPGISRIDQPSHRTHGFFVRVTRKGRIHSAFFTDLMHGGRAPALAAAQRHRQRLLKKLGLPQQKSRRWWAELPRRKGASGIVGVQRVVDWQSWPIRRYWRASWSPEPYVVRHRMFSVRKYGAGEARQLAIRARRAGVRSMKP